MGDTSPNHNDISEHRNPTFYYVGTLDPLGYGFGQCPGRGWGGGGGAKVRNAGCVEPWPFAPRRAAQCITFI